MTDGIGMLFSLALLVLVLALPVLAAIRLRRGALVLCMILWLLLPLLGIAGFLNLDAQSRPSHPNAGRDAELGFVLLAGIVALPWLAVSAVTWGLGLVLRRRLGPQARGQGGPTAPGPWGPYGAPPVRPARFAAWRSALAILVGAAILIGLAAWFLPRPTQLLGSDRIPHFAPPSIGPR